MQIAGVDAHIAAVCKQSTCTIQPLHSPAAELQKVSPAGVALPRVVALQNALSLTCRTFDTGLAEVGASLVENPGWPGVQLLQLDQLVCGQLRQCWGCHIGLNGSSLGAQEDLGSTAGRVQCSWTASCAASLVSVLKMQDRLALRHSWCIGPPGIVGEAHSRTFSHTFPPPIIPAGVPPGGRVPAGLQPPGHGPAHGEGGLTPAPVCSCSICMCGLQHELSQFRQLSSFMPSTPSFSYTGQVPGS